MLMSKEHFLPIQRRLAKKAFDFKHFYIQLPDSLILWIPCIKNMHFLFHLSPWYILKTVGYAAWLWNPQLLVAQGHVARHGADESTAKWANGTTSRDCKDAGRSRIASTVLTQLGGGMNFMKQPSSLFELWNTLNFISIWVDINHRMVLNFARVLDESARYYSRPREIGRSICSLQT